MNNDIVVLNGTIRCAPDELGSFLNAIQLHAQYTRHETGCLYFEIRQDHAESCLFHVSEKFVNEGAFRAHQERTRASQWWKTTQHMTRDYKLTRLKV